MIVVRLLGPFGVEVDGVLVAITALMQRAVLACLALETGHTLSRDQLIDAVWESEPPAQAVNVIQQYVASLRISLGRKHILTQSGGYRLETDGGSVDVIGFRHLLDDASRQRRAGNPGGSLRTLEVALSMCRGAPLIGIQGIASLAGARESVTRAILEARTSRVRALNDVGRAESALPEIAALAAEQPLDEAVALEWMRALARTGRQAEALTVYDVVTTCQAVHADVPRGIRRTKPFDSA